MNNINCLGNAMESILDHEQRVTFDGFDEGMDCLEFPSCHVPSKSQRNTLTTEDHARRNNSTGSNADRSNAKALNMEFWMNCLSEAEENGPSPLSIDSSLLRPQRSFESRLIGVQYAPSYPQAVDEEVSEEREDNDNYNGRIGIMPSRELDYPLEDLPPLPKQTTTATVFRQGPSSTTSGLSGNKADQMLQPTGSTDIFATLSASTGLASASSTARHVYLSSPSDEETARSSSARSSASAAAPYSTRSSGSSIRSLVTKFSQLSNASASNGPASNRSDASSTRSSHLVAAASTKSDTSSTRSGASFHKAPNDFGMVKKSKSESTAETQLDSEDPLDSNLSSELCVRPVTSDLEESQPRRYLHPVEETTEAPAVRIVEVEPMPKPVPNVERPVPVQEEMTVATVKDPFEWAYAVWQRKGLMNGYRSASSGASQSEPAQAIGPTPITAPVVQKPTLGRASTGGCVTPREQISRQSEHNFHKSTDDMVLTSRQSAPKSAQQVPRQFASILKQWKNLSEDTSTNSHFLSPEHASPFREKTQCTVRQQIIHQSELKVPRALTVWTSRSPVETSDYQVTPPNDVTQQVEPKSGVSKGPTMVVVPSVDQYTPKAATGLEHAESAQSKASTLTLSSTKPTPNMPPRPRTSSHPSGRSTETKKSLREEGTETTVGLPNPYSPVDFLLPSPPATQTPVSQASKLKAAAQARRRQKKSSEKKSPAQKPTTDTIRRPKTLPNSHVDYKATVTTLLRGVEKDNGDKLKSLLMKEKDDSTPRHIPISTETRDKYAVENDFAGTLAAVPSDEKNKAYQSRPVDPHFTEELAPVPSDEKYKANQPRIFDHDFAEELDALPSDEKHKAHQSRSFDHYFAEEMAAVSSDEKCEVYPSYSVGLDLDEPELVTVSNEKRETYNVPSVAPILEDHPSVDRRGRELDVEEYSVRSARSASLSFRERGRMRREQRKLEVQKTTGSSASMNVSSRSDYSTVTPRGMLIGVNGSFSTGADKTSGSVPESPWMRLLEEDLLDEGQALASKVQASSSRPWKRDIVMRFTLPTLEGNDVNYVGEHSPPSAEGRCKCSESLFSGKDDLVEFYLPLMGMACTCGARPSRLRNEAEPIALENILRPWQAEFLAAFGIYRGDQLVKAHHRSADALASALRRYRREHHMTPFRTKSCGMAISIWAKTTKAFVRSIRKQLTSGTDSLKVPNTLYILSSFLEKMPMEEPGITPPRTTVPRGMLLDSASKDVANGTDYYDL